MLILKGAVLWDSVLLHKSNLRSRRLSNIYRAPGGVWMKWGEENGTEAEGGGGGGHFPPRFTPVDKEKGGNVELDHQINKLR